MSDLLKQFGEIDIYLFDQILRSRIVRPMTIFDAGCGGGRNLVYFLREGYEVCGVDMSVQAVAVVRQLAAELAPSLPHNNFRAEPLQATSFPDRSADVVISSAVLHFASDDEEFDAMLQGTWRVLKPGGLFFCRLASSIGIENRIEPLGNGRRCRLPDGSDRYLVDEGMLVRLTAQLGGTLLDPLKTTVVQGLRSMTTWVVRKGR